MDPPDFVHDLKGGGFTHIVILDANSLCHNEIESYVVTGLISLRKAFSNWLKQFEPDFSFCAEERYQAAQKKLIQVRRAVALAFVKRKIVQTEELYVGDLWTYREAKHFHRQFKALSLKEKELLSALHEIICEAAKSRLELFEERLDKLYGLKQLANCLPNLVVLESMREAFEQQAQRLVSDLDDAIRLLKTLSKSPNLELATKWKSDLISEADRSENEPDEAQRFLKKLLDALRALKQQNTTPLAPLEATNLRQAVARLESEKKRLGEIYNAWLNRERMARARSDEKLAVLCVRRQRSIDRTYTTLEKYVPLIQGAVSEIPVGEF